MASPLQTLTATMFLVSLLLVSSDQVIGMRYIPNSSNEIKNSDFLVNIAPQASGLIPRLGRFLLPPKARNPFHPYPYKAPFAAAPIPSCGIPTPFAPNPAYEPLSPTSGADPVPPVPQPLF